MLLKGKKVFITGGSRGLGNSMLLELAAQGAQVVFTYVANREAAEATLQELKENYPESHPSYYQLDVTDSKQVKAVVEHVTEELGRIDVVVNNAGNLRDGLIYSMSDDAWEEVIKIHLHGTFYVCRAFLGEFIHNKGGKFINIASLSYLGSAGQANYAAAKAGVIGFSKSLAKEYGSLDIYCNVLVPGFFKTELTDRTASDTVTENFLRLSSLQREGDPGEFGQALVFLASDLSSFINGEVLHVTGGLENIPPVTARRRKKRPGPPQGSD